MGFIIYLPPKFSLSQRYNLEVSYMDEEIRSYICELKPGNPFAVYCARSKIPGRGFSVDTSQMEMPVCIRHQHA